MKQLGKWGVVLAVVIYAAWIAWPVVRTYILPQPPAMAASAQDDAGEMPMDGDTGAPITESIQGDTAVDAVATHNVPVVILWGAVLFLYLLAAIFHAGGGVRTIFVYTAAFVGDLVLTYLAGGASGSGMWDKLSGTLSDWDSRYLLTLAAIALGIPIYRANRAPDGGTAQAAESDAGRS